MTSETIAGALGGEASPSGNLSSAPGIDEVFACSPFGVDQVWRRRHLVRILAELTTHHHRNCASYRAILDASGGQPGTFDDLATLPFLPIGLFKRLDLLSVPPSEVYRTLISSGTSRSARARVHLDRNTSVAQMMALVRIVTSVLGEKRLPMLIIDAPHVSEDPAAHAARSVAVNGFSLLSAGSPTFALGPDMEPRLDQIREFVRATEGQKRLLFGFTYVIWRHFLERLKETRVELNLGDSVLIHGGGWKRLSEDAITDATFRHCLRERLGLTRIHDYYGMVEQPGSIHLQCADGSMHCSAFSEILVRRPDDLTVAEPGEPGILQTFSILPRSYPGHSLLTEDMGVLRGEDDCGCGRLGKYFDVLGRVPSAELRGCGDTHSAVR